MSSWWSRSQAFITEVRSEMKKVSFPSKDEVVSTTIVVLVTSLIFAVFLYAADIVISFGYEGILKVF